MAITKTDVAGWWDFDEGTGTTITDKTGANNGTAANTPTWVSDGPTNLPNGLDFVAASSQFVDFNNNYTNNSGSAAAWFRPDTVATNGVLFGDGNVGGGGDFDLYITSSTIQGRTRFVTSGDEIVSNAISNNILYFVVYTWTDPDLELFLNGSSVDTNSTGTGGITAGTDDLHAATRTSESGLFYDGSIYQTILFNRVLTSAEVSELYNSGAGITYEQFFFSSKAGATFFTPHGFGLN